MEISKWLVTGDTHGDFSRFYAVNTDVPENEIWGIIILGDAGINYWLNTKDEILKHRIYNKYNKLCFYCIRGNHEERPSKISTMKLIWDNNVKGYVYYEPDYPNIKYFQDCGGEYIIGTYKTLIIPGAYSIDKYYRIERAKYGSYAGWFEEEQLTEKEREKIEISVFANRYDLILSHTCPQKFQPIDLFLSGINQSMVDNSMEEWMDKIDEITKYGVWLFGHYHRDRIQAPYVEMLYFNVIELNKIIHRWSDYKLTGKLPNDIEKSPNWVEENNK